jgi:hypothetical protein
MATRKRAEAGPIVLGDRTVPVSRLHLSKTNPRHEPVGTEAEAIAQLCDSEMIAELAEDIAQRGSLSPLEVLGVMPMEGHPGHYVALEGNRRTCALVLLVDPERAPKKFQAALKRVAAKAILPRDIKVHVFPNAASAKQWIDLRHLGQQGGAGTKDWTPTQQLRAAGGNQKTSARANTLALAVLDRLEKRGLLDRQQREEVNLSTITRYLGTPGVRAIVGLASPSELLYTHDADEVDTGLQRLVLDSIEVDENDNVLVHSRSDSKERLAYAHGLRERGFAPRSAATAPAPPPKPTRATTAKKVSPGKRSTNALNSRHLIDRSFTVAVNDVVLRALRQEAIDLQLETYRFAGNYLLRAIVERVMVLFAKKFHCLQARMSDEDLTNACLAQLKKLSAPPSVITTVNQATNRSQSHSLHSLGHAVHGGSMVPARDTVARFHTWEPALQEMLGHL